MYKFVSSCIGKPPHVSEEAFNEVINHLKTETIGPSVSIALSSSGKSTVSETEADYTKCDLTQGPDQEDLLHAARLLLIHGGASLTERKSLILDLMSKIYHLNIYADNISDKSSIVSILLRKANDIDLDKDPQDAIRVVKEITAVLDT